MTLTFLTEGSKSSICAQIHCHFDVILTAAHLGVHDPAEVVCVEDLPVGQARLRLLLLHHAGQPGLGAPALGHLHDLAQLLPLLLDEPGVAGAGGGGEGG